VATLSNDQAKLFADKNFAVVATVNPDGSPQSSVVWVDWDGESVIFNTTRPRAKGRNLERDPRVSVTVFDGENPYRYVEVAGAVELDDEGAGDHINELSHKYTGQDYAASREGRVIVRLRPERVHAMGVE
jgi:PPOX class probable F420-dependent enzyme